MRLDVIRNKKFTVETRQFAIELWNLPRLSKDFDVHRLKIELWSHITNLIKDED